MTIRRMDYNELAGPYGAYRRPNAAVIELLLQLAGDSSEPRLLEIGTGTGNFASTFEQHFPNQVYGIDPSIEMLKQVPGPVAHRIALARAEQLPFPGGLFTLMYSVDVIHHVRDRDAAAREALRVLRPGGQIAVVTDSEADIANRVPLSRYFPETSRNEIARYPRIESLQAELGRAGFVDIGRRHTVTTGELTDITPYREKAFSSLHLISDAAHARGVAALETALADGPIPTRQPYTTVVARKPMA